MPDDEFFDFVKLVLEKEGIPADDYARKVCALVKERCAFPQDIIEHGGYFFRAPESYDAGALKKRWKPGTSAHLTEMAHIIDADFAKGKGPLHDAVIGYATEQGLNLGSIMNSLRIALVGAAKGPEIFDIIELLGKDETLARIARAVDVIKD